MSLSTLGVRSLARWLLVLALVCLGNGCQTVKVDWDARVGSYTFDQAVLDMGPPDKIAPLTDGTRVAEWLTFRSGGNSFVGFGIGYRYGPGMYYSGTSPITEYFLRLTFDPDGKLRSWKRVAR